MIKILKYIFSLSLLLSDSVTAQQFIKSAAIEYEVKTNIRKNMWDGFFTDQLTENLPQLKTAYYTLTFSGDRSIYKFDHWGGDRKLPAFLTSADENSVWYTDLKDDDYEMQKVFESTEVIVKGSIQPLPWRMTNETRVIAGFSCRKAFTILFDSVYVFAFYTDQIVFSGGPCRLHGLPGVILAMTVPRLYMSWFATKVMVNDVDKSEIIPIKGKKKYDLNFLKNTFIDANKDWYDSDSTENRKIQQFKSRELWNLML
jgi:GLPGLI family protein